MHLYTQMHMNKIYHNPEFVSLEWIVTFCNPVSRSGILEVLRFQNLMALGYFRRESLYFHTYGITYKPSDSNCFSPDDRMQPSP